jgi:hypothetical protein
VGKTARRWMNISFRGLLMLMTWLTGVLKKNAKVPSEDTKESVYLRRTDNTMAKGKRTKGQTTINKTYI